jgi:ABC-type multidrug transport system fused ATPase/permease subunit
MNGAVLRAGRRHARKVAGSIVLGLLAAACGLAQPAALGLLLRELAANRPLTGAVLVTVGLFAGELILTSLQAYVSGRTGERIVFDVRRLLFARLLAARVGPFSRLRQGDVLTRTVSDTAALKVALAQSLSGIVVDGFMLAGGLVLMFVIDPLLLAITAGCLAATGVLSLLLAGRLRLATLRQRDVTGELTADLHRAVGALTTVKVSRAERFEADRLTVLADRARAAGGRVAALSAVLSPIMTIGVQASLAAVLVTGMGRVATGSLAPADLTAFVMYLFYLVTPMVGLFLSIGQLQQGRASAQRVNELAELPGEDGPAPVPVPAAPARVVTGDALLFDDVRFAYEDGRPVLDGVSFAVPRRRLTAIVGPSGTGKTTLFDLIVRLHEPEAGGIRLDGVDVRAIPLPELRGRVGYVRQDNVVIRGTIRENLCYAAPDAGPDDLERALWLAGLEETVARLPRGLDTDVEDGGVGLSGGQRQRLAVARVLAARPEVLLLDEATAQLDPDAELALRRSIRHIAGYCTVVSIAHRLSTVVDADRIVVLDAGRVRRTGTHAELLDTSAEYRRLTEIQFGRSAPAGVGAVELARAEGS